MLDVSGAVARGRQMAEARMLDTFDIKVPTGAKAYNPTTKLTEQTYTLLFSTPGRVKNGGLGILDHEIGGRTSIEVRRELHIPVDSPAVPAGAVAFVTSVHATSDPTLAGARLTLAGPSPGSQTTARRLEVTEVIT